MSELLLLPQPRVVKKGGAAFGLPGKMFISLEDHPATRDIFAAERFVIEAEPLLGAEMRIAVVPVGRGPISTPVEEIRVRFEEKVEHEQGYWLLISGTGIEISARAAAGTFYAFQTLMQIVRQSVFEKGGGRGAKLPEVMIKDWPDFARRGVYHDCSRGKVPTVDTLLQLIDDLGHLKYNEFQLYVENTFEFRKYPEMYDDTNPFTAEEILLLDSACKARHIDFVPSLTSLGHFEKILSRPAFRHLAEVEPEELKKAGVKTWSEQPWTLCVTDPAAREFLKDMYDEFVPNFSSKTFNICCDESWDLGKGRSKPLADQIGVGQMYVDWVNYCNGLAKSHGKSIQMWGDIILNHPELIPQLPEDAVLLEWGYESHHKFDEHCAVFAKRIRGPQNGGNQKFYVAPGTASWLSLAGRTRNAFGNIHAAAVAGLKHGAAGMLVTDWGDNGHQQLRAVSLLPFAYGAAAGWNLSSVSTPAIAEAPNWETGIVPAGSKQADRGVRPFLEAASLHLFIDPTKTFASLAYELGLTYERFSWQRFNGSLEWFLFREKWDFANYVNRAQPRDLGKVIAACEQLIRKFEQSHLGHADADQLKAEFIFTCEVIIHTCRRTALRQAWLAAAPANRNPEEKTLRTKAPKPLPKTFKAEMKRLAGEAAALERQFAKLWLARNKRSRLADISGEFARLKREYKQFGG